MAIPQWRCDECGEVHEDWDSALECCPPSVSRVFVCPTCDKVYEMESMVHECDHQTDESVTKAELEAVGQMRLSIS